MRHNPCESYIFPEFDFSLITQQSLWDTYVQTCNSTYTLCCNMLSVFVCSCTHSLYSAGNRSFQMLLVLLMFTGTTCKCIIFQSFNLIFDLLMKSWNLKVIVLHAQTIKYVLLFEMFFHEHNIMHINFRVPFSMSPIFNECVRCAAQNPVGWRTGAFPPNFPSLISRCSRRHVKWRLQPIRSFSQLLLVLWILSGFSSNSENFPWGCRIVLKKRIMSPQAGPSLSTAVQLRGTPVVPIKVAHFRMIMGAAWKWRSLTCWGNKSGTLWWEHLFQPNCQRPQLTFSHILSLRAVFHPNGPSAVY